MKLSELFEMQYDGNVGVHEIFRFMSMANNDQKRLFNKLVKEKKTDELWDLIFQVTGMRITR